MNLKYRSSDPLSDAIDLGQTKFSYAVNVQFKEVVEDIGFGTAVGNLLIDFKADRKHDDLVTILGSATVYDSAGHHCDLGRQSGHCGHERSSRHD